MRQSIAAVLAALTVCSAASAELTPTEKRWLQGAWPVVAWAKAAQLPLDIVVQPQPAPHAAPLAMAFVDGRCKLVLSMRDNPQAQATLDRIDPELLDATLELMAAHELGHCHRHLDGSWSSLPAGVTSHPPAGLVESLHTAWAEMQATRREEAYADLVGLAWVRRHHAQDYPRLHAWLVAERSRERVAGDHHDTLAWIASAGGATFAGATVFAAAGTLWPRGFESASGE